MSAVKEKMEDLVGVVCKVLLPLPIDLFVGGSSTISLCTLSSFDLLIQISKHHVLKHITLAGRLLSENKGIDEIIQYFNRYPNSNQLIICGEDIKGHYPGDALINLHRNGIDSRGKIILTKAMRPFLKSSLNEIENFRKIKIYDLRGCCDIGKISELVYSLNLC